MLTDKCLTMILAGGEGRRLYPRHVTVQNRQFRSVDVTELSTL